jgi:hypothetical protein
MPIAFYCLHAQLKPDVSSVNDRHFAIVYNLVATRFFFLMNLT